MAMVVGKIIVSAMVSRAASLVVAKVASGLGFSDSASNLFGSIAGIVAGSYTYSAMGASSAGGAVTNQASNSAEFMGSTTQPSGVTTTPMVDGSVASGSGNAMSEAAINSQPVIDAGGAVSTGAEKVADKEWYEKILDSDKTTDVLVGAAGNAAGAMITADSDKDEAEREMAEKAAYNDSWRGIDLNLFPRLEYPTIAKSGLNPVQTPQTQAPTVGLNPAKKDGMLTR